jgi:DeoR/GlpR family transcriptional regulator of sugar metabolism
MQEREALCFKRMIKVRNPNEKPTPERGDKQASRAMMILKEIRQAGSVSVEALSETLQVSLATIRRDLEALEGSGLLRRTHGGAIPIEPLFYEPFRHDQSFQDQVGRFAEEKRRIAMAAAELVSPGDTIALTAGAGTSTSS